MKKWQKEAARRERRGEKLARRDLRREARGDTDPSGGEPEASAKGEP